MLKNLSDIGLSLYFLFDHVLLINKINAYKFSQSTLNLADFLATFSWLIDTFSTLFYQILEISAINQQISKAKLEIKNIDTQTEGKLLIN